MCMNKNYISLITAFFFITCSFAQTVVVTGADPASNAGSPYTTLGAAFTSINSASQAGNNILITISGTTTETSSAFLLQSAGPWASLTINPIGVAAVTGNILGGLISLTGADNVTIDGLNSGGNSLAIDNANTGNASAIRFVNDATNNTIIDCNLLGSSASGASAVVFFGGGSLTTGNDNNTITECNISASSGGTPINGILSIGTSPALDNSNNTISVNNISDFFNAASGSTGIQINSNNTAWTITNNALYQTATRTITGNSTYHCIWITTGSGYIIHNNVIGFAAPNATGTTNMIGLSSGSLGGTFPSSFTPGGVAGTPRFCGITCAFTPGGAVSSIQNNTIAGIAFYTGNGSSTANGILCGIQVTSGNANIGTVTGNTIGSATGTHSIYAASTTAGAVVSGIYCTSTNTINIQNNIIGGIDVSGTSVTGAAGFKGIDVASSGNFNISNNMVGNATANNIRTGYLLTGGNLSNTATTPTAASGFGVIRCIAANAGGATLDISNNITQGILVSGTASPYTGISSVGNVATMNINSNQLGNAVTNAVTFPFVTSNTVFGISIFTFNPGTANINNNSIYGMICAGANSVRGIITSNGASLTTININNNSITNNVINGTAVGSTMYGITNSSVASILNITGNIIRSNSSTATTGGFTGIENTGAVINTINITNNQLGNASGGAVTFSAATTGAITGINNTSAASTATISITDNSVQGISCVSSGAVAGIDNGPFADSEVGININNNQFGTATGDYITYSAATANTIRGVFNAGGTGNCVVTIQNNSIRGIVHTVTATSFHIYISNTATGILSENINSNTFNNLNVNTSGNVTFLNGGGGIPATGTTSCSNNAIVTAFNKSAANGDIFIYVSGTACANGSTMTETGNNFSNITVSGTSIINGWQNSGGFSSVNGPTRTITGNTFSNITAGSGAIRIMSLYLGGPTNCSSNTITNITGSGNIYGINFGVNNGAGTHTCAFNTISSLVSTGTGGFVKGILGGYSAMTTWNINNNSISSLSSNSAAGVLIEGIEVNDGVTVNVNNNQINNLSGAGGGATAALGIGVYGGNSVNLYNNNIHSLSLAAVTMGISTTCVNGIYFAAGTTCTAYNNFISNLNTPNVNAANAIAGIEIGPVAGPSTFNLYYNSIYLNAASSGTNFGTYGVNASTNAIATTGALNMINNIIVNTSTPNGTGVTAAYGRSNTTLTNYAATSDYNLFYAGTPSASRLIFYDGTNSDQTLSAYQTRVSTRDANSISLMPTFTSATDLHLTAANCQIDGKGIPIGAVTDDIDLAARNAALPDIGADEFTAAAITTLAGVAGAPVCEYKNISISGTTYISNACGLIATVLPSGGNPVTGNVNVCVTLDATQQTFNGEPYVQRHFDIEPSMSPSTATATITLYFTNAEFVLYNTTNPVVWPRLPTAVLGNADPNRANVKVTQFHGAANTSPSSPGNYPGSSELIDPLDANVVWNGIYWAVTFDVTGFSGFYVHTNNFNAPLPITVNYLTGRKQGSNHLLNWKLTCNSTPSVTMTLERSSDSRNFSGINTITADAARCNQPFDHTDANPLKGMNYYRLKMVDAAGKVTYSTTVALLNSVKGFDIISIAPNPVVSNNFRLNIASAQSGKMEFVIFDMQGRLVNRQTLSLIAGYNSMPVNVANLAPGTYTIKGNMADDQSKVIRFVKQ